MKKKLLFLGALALSSMSAFAQWSLPEVKTSDLVVGEVMYLYNKDAGAFMRGLGDGNVSPYWGTRAGVAVEGADSVIINPAIASNVPEDTQVSADVDIPWLEEWDGKTCLVQVWSSHRHQKWDEMWFSLMNFSEIYIDRQFNVNGNANFFWDVVKNDNGSYSISVSNKSTYLADPELYAELIVTDPETGEITSSPVIIGGEKLGVDLSSADLVAYLEGYNDNAPLSCEWYFVTKEDYEALDLEAFSRYYEAISLKNYIEESKAAYPSVDFSAAEAVYNNTESSLAELQAAKELVKKAILDFQASDATPENPKDMTAAITNPTFDEIGNFDGWSGTQFGAGGTTSTCAELYDKENFNTYQDLQNLPVGVYKVGVKGFYRAGSPDNDWNTKDDPSQRHAILYARSGEDSLYVTIPSLSSTARENPVYITTDNGETAEYGMMNAAGYYVPNSMLDFTYFKEAENSTIKEISVLVPVSDNKLRIGLAKNAHLGTDWCIVDDFTLEYYGNSLEAYIAWKDQMLADIPSLEELIPEEALYNEAYKAAYEDAINTANTATDAATITAAIKAISPAVEALQANIAAYAAWKAKVDEVEAYFAEHDDLEGDSVGYVTDYIQDESEPGEYYPNGGAIYIAENTPFTTEQMVAELANVEKWFQAAVRDGMRKGSDVSYLLINPTFKDGFTGWTYKVGAVGGVPDVCPNVEVFSNVVEVYQVVKGVQPGIYSINVQAFERPAGNGEYDGTEDAKVFLFMNEFQTPVMNIVEDAIPEEEAVYLENAFHESTEWHADYYFTSPDGSIAGYVPNGMIGASYAFSAGRYLNTCYGIVGEDGVMKIGLTSNGQTAHWVLWANFKLIYEGEDEVAIKSILESTIETVNEYMNYNAAEMNTLAITALTEALNKAEGAIGGDYATIYAALTELNAAYAAAKEHVAAYSALIDAQMVMDETSIIYEETASLEALGAYADLSDKLADIENLTTAEIAALIDECNYVIAALKVPNTASEATDENPVDMTSLIANADFIEGAEVGWSYTKNSGNGPIYDNCYDGPGFEFWHGEVDQLAFNIFQTLYALPAGKYMLTADLANSYNGQTPGTTGGRGVLYATVVEGTDSTTYSVAVEPQTEDCTARWNNYQVTFDVPAGASVVVGAKTSGVMDARWFMGDTFTLTYYGAQSVKENSGDFTGIESVETAEVVTSNYYTLGGAKVAAPVKGINIVRSVLSDGTVKIQKIFVK